MAVLAACKVSWCRQARRPTGPQLLVPASLTRRRRCRARPRRQQLASARGAPPCTGSILFQRGIYPQDTFIQKKHYGLAMMVTKDDGLLAYLTNVTKQMTGAPRWPLP
jgi:hypothetical protein